MRRTARFRPSSRGALSRNAGPPGPPGGGPRPVRPRLIFLLLFLVVSRAGRAESARQALDEAKALQQKGAVAEARKRYEAMLPSLRATDRELLGRALFELGNLLSTQGDYDGAIARARESAEVYRS